jgi:hypothetical protein
LREASFARRTAFSFDSCQAESGHDPLGGGSIGSGMDDQADYGRYGGNTPARGAVPSGNRVSRGAIINDNRQLSCVVSCVPSIV